MMIELGTAAAIRHAHHGGQYLPADKREFEFVINRHYNSGKRTRHAVLTGLATVCLALCLISWYRVSGNEYGMFYGVFVEPSTSGFAVHAPNYYQSINTWYFVVSVCVMLFLASRWLGQSIPAAIVRIITLCVAIFPFRNMLMYKYVVKDVRSRLEWLETSIYLDWACLVFIAAMMCIEIGLLISRKPESKKLQLEIMTYVRSTYRHPGLLKNELEYTVDYYEGSLSTLCAGCGHDSINAGRVGVITWIL